MWTVTSVPYNGCVGIAEEHETCEDAKVDLRERIAYRERCGLECELIEGSSRGAQRWECQNDGLISDMHGYLVLKRKE